MRPLGPWAARVLAAQPRQPDQRSCGASVLVVERALRDEGYARLLADGPLTERFRDEVLSMHRRTTSPVDVAGRLQLPWPRALGTPPWAVVGQLSRPAHPYVVRWARLGGRRAALATRLTTAVRAGATVPLYIGDRWLPRHVVLVVDVDDAGDRLRCYDPGRGLRTITAEQLARAALGPGRWTHPWCAVLPRS